MSILVLYQSKAGILPGEKHTNTGVKMELKYEILQKALHDMKEIHGIPRQEVTENSGVHNLLKIINGKISPTPDSWWKLHKAYPKYIPEPQYTDGELVYKPTQSVSNSTNTNQNLAGRDIITGSEQVSREDRELCEMLLLHGTQKIKQDLLKLLREIKKLSA